MDASYTQRRLRLALWLLAVLSVHLQQATVCLPTASSSSSPESCSIDAQHYIDCHPEPNANEAECSRRNCCWLEWPIADTDGDSLRPPHVAHPKCYFPAHFNCFDIKRLSSENQATKREQQQQQRDYFQLIDDDDSEFTRNQQAHKPATTLTWLLSRKASCPASGFPDDAKSIEVKVSVHGDSHINIKISEPGKHRFEPSLPEIHLPSSVGRQQTDSAGALPVSYKDVGRLAGRRNGKRQQQQQQNRLTVGEFAVELEADANNSLNNNQTSSSGVLKVIHQISGAILFETDLGKLIYSRRFIQLPTLLPSAFVYGLGQHMGESLLKSSSDEPSKSYAKSYTMFNYGHPPQPDGRTAYSSYPFYINLAQLDNNNNNNNNNNNLMPDINSAVNGSNFFDGNTSKRKLIATGGLMLNSNAMDVLVHPNIQPGRAGITWRLVGGVVNLFIFVGPTPNDVIDQYQSLVGEPMLPPPWALGYHQSRHNYGELLPIKMAWAKTRSAGIPMESFWTDLEFQWHTTSYSLDKPELNELVKILQDQFDMHYVPIVDPAISVRENLDEYEALKMAESMDLFASYLNEGKDSSTPALVTSWSESKQNALLDFTHPNIVAYLQLVLEDYKRKLNFDGIWLDMNEPEVFANHLVGPDGQLCPDDPEMSYLPAGRKLHDRTMCMSAQFRAGQHYDLHNLYSFYQTKAHYEALKLLYTDKRPFILSRSQFVGQGKYSGTWLGDLASHFEHMRWSVVGMIESNWFGQPLVGADICGFFGSTTDELCARWFSLGAFYPFARNHNDGSARDQDPGSMNESVQQAARIAMVRRYSLLPYLYTLFYENHLKREPVIRSILFEHFSKFSHLTGANLKDLPQINDQFMWGSAIMIAPIMYENSRARSVYLPPGTWYDISIGMRGTSMAQGIYDGLRSNWPLMSHERGVERLDEAAKRRLDGLRKGIDCREPTGCWLHDQYTPLEAINIYLRGGRIVPTFRFVDHTDSVGMLWKKPTFFLEVALDSSQEAIGSLYWDDGQSDPQAGQHTQAHFWASINHLTVSIVEQNYSNDTLKFEGFVVYGVKSIKQVPISTMYHGSVLVYIYNGDTESLSCLFMSPTVNETRPLTPERYDSLRFRW